MKRRQTVTLAVAVALVGLVSGCSRSDARPEHARVDVLSDAARYAPGQPVRITVHVSDPDADIAALHVSHLGAPVGAAQRASLAPRPGGGAAHTFVWTPPAIDHRGYLLRVDVTDAHGRRMGRGDNAVDVSSSSSRFPRYGFVSDFGRRVNPTAVAAALRRYHLTDVQFYDWQYRHHQPLAGTARVWRDIARREIDRRTLLALIDRVQAGGADALNYNLLYGADAGYGEDRSGVDPRWGLFRDGDCRAQDAHPLPNEWAANEIFLMDPANPDWQRYFSARENAVFAAYPFRGLQADQLGQRGPLNACDGQPADLAGRFGSFIDAFAGATHKKIIFNAVGQYGQANVAANPNLPYLYTEAWPQSGQKTYADLKRVIDDNRAWSAGKSTVLAAYVNRTRGHSPGRFNAAGVLTADAAIFAAGGAHNELGDAGHMLSDEYYPNHNLRVDARLQDALRHYYDFLVAYENLLRDTDVQSDSAETAIRDVKTSTDGHPGTVWTFAKRKTGTQILHFINLMGNRSADWQDAAATRAGPPVLAGKLVRHHYTGSPPTSVMLASPDRDGGQAQRLRFTTGRDQSGAYVQFRLPRLGYWDMVWLT